MQKTAYEMRISDWSSDVCSSDLDDLMEGRVALVETQEQADLEAQAVLAGGPRMRRVRGAAEQYLLGPAARLISPALMRMQVPALQVRIDVMGLGAIALVPIELVWTGTGFCPRLPARLIERRGGGVGRRVWGQGDPG